MNKRTIVALSIASLLLFGFTIAGLSLLWLNKDVREVHFNFKRDSLSIDIRQRNTDGSLTDITSLSSSSFLKMKPGNYIATPSSTDTSRPISDSDILFTVKEESVEIDIDPLPSWEYRMSILERERDYIHASISDKYPDILSEPKPVTESILDNGEWYGAIIPIVQTIDYTTDNYLIAVRKTPEGWVVVGKPQIVVTTLNSPDIPLHIIKQLNNLHSIR